MQTCCIKRPRGRAFALVLWLVMLFPVLALGEKDPLVGPLQAPALPEEVLRYLAEDGDADLQEQIRFETPQGEWLYLLGPFNFLGFVKKDGQFDRYLHSQNPFWNTGVEGRLRPHQAHEPIGGYAGFAPVYPDSLGFDVAQKEVPLGSKEQRFLSFHWVAGELRLLAYQSAQELAILEQDQWVFWNPATGERLGSARMDYVTRHGGSFQIDELPANLKEARQLEALNEDAIKDAFTGFVLGQYECYNSGKAVSAGYYRLNGRSLTVKQTAWQAGLGLTKERDSLTLPVTQAFAQRLNKEGPEALMSLLGYASVVLDGEALDREQLPLTGKILENDWYQNELVALVETESGDRKIQLVTPGESGFVVRSSHALPMGSSLDIFHAGDGSILVYLGFQEGMAGFSRDRDGHYLLTSLSQQENDFRVRFYGLEGNEQNQRAYGVWPGRDLLDTDFLALPRTFEQAAAMLIRSGLAVVNNPNPKDRLHLREQPKLQSASLGKFYNGTPVFVLEEQGDWVRVRLGTQGLLEGYMKREFLAFGASMDQVQPAFPDFVFLEGKEKAPPLLPF